MTQTRTCRREDIAAVTRIFQKTFRDPRRPPTPALQNCIEELLFEHGEDDDGIGSLVAVDDAGRVTGFIGVRPLAMRLDDRLIRAAIPTSIAVEDPKADPLAGARLVRAFLSGPQDISISEPANALAQGLWDKLGGMTVAGESMEWLRIFRPAGLALALAGERRLLGRAARPVAAVADRFAARFFAPPGADRARGETDSDCDRDGMVEALAGVARHYRLRPAWPSASLRFMLDHAAANASRGPLHRRIVRDRRGEPAGCYVYHGKAGGIGFVIQLLARPDAAGATLDSLLDHARGIGCVGVKGRTQARFLEALLRRGCLMFRRHTAMIHSRDTSLVEAVRAGEAITSGFAGEAWMRHVSDPTL